MYPFRYIMDTIRGWFKRRFSRNFRLEVQTLQIIRTLAEQEKRTPEELVDSLLVNAFLDQQTGEETNQRWRTLTRREMDVAALVCLNYTTREIAERLNIAQPTVKTHVTHILSKFDVPDRGTLRLLLNGWDFREWDK